MSTSRALTEASWVLSRNVAPTPLNLHSPLLPLSPKALSASSRSLALIPPSDRPLPPTPHPTPSPNPSSPAGRGQAENPPEGTELLPACDSVLLSSSSREGLVRARKGMGMGGSANLIGTPVTQGTGSLPDTGPYHLLPQPSPKPSFWLYSLPLSSYIREIGSGLL